MTSSREKNVFLCVIWFRANPIGKWLRLVQRFLTLGSVSSERCGRVGERVSIVDIVMDMENTCRFATYMIDYVWTCVCKWAVSVTVSTEIKQTL